MRIGLLGPADGNLTLLREAAEFLLRDYGVDQAVYLGPDDGAVELVVEQWAQQVMGRGGAGEARIPRRGRAGSPWVETPRASAPSGAR